MARVSSAIVIGGGIGGLTTSLALRAAGIDAQVYERATQPLLLGGGMTIFQNAMRVLGQLGLAEKVEGAGRHIDTMDFESDQGRRFARWRMDKIEQDEGIPAISLQRADLQAVLADACAGHLHLGATCTALEEREGSVRATFADGREATADVLVGADGITSGVRTLLHGEVPLRYLGFTLWQGVAQGSPPGLLPGGSFHHRFGRGVTVGWYPVGGDRLYWYVTRRGPIGGRDPEGGAKPELQRLLASWAAPVPAILEASDPASIVRADIRDLPYQETWGRGRVTLIGDAAHAMSFMIGQGACQAMEDGASVTRHLLDDPDVPAALRSYEGERQQATKPLVTQAHRIGKSAHWSHPAAVVVRELVMRVGLNGPGRAQHFKRATVRPATFAPAA